MSPRPIRQVVHVAMVLKHPVRVQMDVEIGVVRPDAADGVHDILFAEMADVQTLTASTVKLAMTAEDHEELEKLAIAELHRGAVS